MMSRIRLMNTEVDNLTMNEALDRIDKLIQKGIPSYVVTPNVDHIVKLENNTRLQQVYKKADLILADGKPLVWISKLYGTPLKEKISGSDLFPLLCELAAEKGYRVFFLGAADGVAKKAAERLMKRYPNLDIVGTYSPSFGFEENDVEKMMIKERIINSRPHILIVGLGCPKQEFYIYNNLEELGVPISLGLGASFDFESGRVKRAPRWMRDNGLEWLFRLVQEPRRMIKRYLFDDIRIISIAWKYRHMEHKCF